jgi:asparagine synthase (glutamine-hydrolysing)
MSVIFGVYDPTEPMVTRESFERLAQVTARYGPDGTFVSAKGSIGMAYQAFRTHRRSGLEQQPTTDHLGNMIVFDGRLDNYDELSGALGIKALECSDSGLILKAFQNWSQECFSHLVGEWAVALWSVQDRALYLARDHSGSRTLFYRVVRDQIIWSTFLETFLKDQSPPDLNKEYLARILSCGPVGESTPYRGIQAVPPAHYIVLKDGQVTIRPHWNWIAGSQIVYRGNAEYDEHFLHLFGQAIKRRTGSGSRILAELSGGMDSSSIVCMSDHMVSGVPGPADRLETVSYFDDRESDWDDRPYFQAVERYRGQEGIHIDFSSRVPDYEPLILLDRVYPYVCGDRSYFRTAAQFQKSVGAGKYRVILSGIGGDELLGGVPTAIPELANYIRQGSLLKLLSRAFAWCLVGRQPLFHMLYGAVKSTISLYRRCCIDYDSIPSWLTPDLRKSCSHFHSRLGSNGDLFFAKPSAIANGRTWWAMLETLPNQSPRLMGCYEHRFPYLDRDLVDFLLRVPRGQLVQPGRRRVLMRRAMRGIVPSEVLERKRKAFVSRGPLGHIQGAQEKVEELFAAPLTAEFGLIDRRRFLAAFHAELAGEMKWMSHLTNAIEVELWLRGLTASPLGSLRGHIGHQQINEFPPSANGANGIRTGSAGT